MKKIISMALVVLMLFALVSCGLVREPEDFQEALKKRYGNDIALALTETENGIKMMGSWLGLDPDGVTAVLRIDLEIDGDNEMGYVIYCEDSKTAKNMKADCEELVDKYHRNYVIKQIGNNVYVGDEDVWKAIMMV